MKTTNITVIAAALLLILSSCDTDLFRQMDRALDEVENRMGYVNTLETRDVRKMADWFERRGDDSRKGRALY